MSPSNIIPASVPWTTVPFRTTAEYVVTEYQMRATETVSPLTEGDAEDPA